MVIFDVALEKRFDDSTDIATIDVSANDSLLIRDTSTGLIMRLPFSTLTAALATALSGSFATLVDGKVQASQLPSYVDDVLEYANLAAFPGTGEGGKIYVAIDTRKTFRWSGSAYVEISPSDVNSVAGKTGIVTLVKADVGLSNVDNTSDANKPVSTTQAAAIALKADLANPVFTGQLGVPDAIINTAKVTAIAALSTPVTFGPPCSALLRVRDETLGGAALFLCDPNGGVQVIGVNQITGLSVGFGGGSVLQFTLSSGAVPRNLNWNLIGTF